MGAIVGGGIYLFRRLLILAVVQLIPVAVAIAVIGFIVAGKANNKPTESNQVFNPSSSTASHPASYPHDSQKASMVRLLDNLEKNQQRQEGLAQEFDAKFAAVNMADVLTPVALTTSSGISRSRATVRRFRELIDERRRLSVSFLDERERILRSSSLDQANQQAALGAFNSSKKQTLILIDNLEAIQREIIGSITKIIDLCASSLGQLGIQDGNILFQSQEQLDQYRIQLVLIQRYTEAEENAMAVYIAHLQKGRQSLQEVRALIR